MHRDWQFDGRFRSVVTLPEYRLGMPPDNFGKKYPAEVLTTTEVKALLAAMPRRGFAGPRNRALVVVMWRSGLRVAEALALTPKDVDLERGTINVLHGKGDRSRVVGIDPEAAALVDLWIQQRRKLRIGPNRALFCVISVPRQGRPLYSSYVREMLKDAATKARIEKRVHPHGLRHTYAAQLAGEGVPIHVIRKALGHSSLATTERYVDHLAPLEVIRAMQRRTWDPPATHQDLAA